MTPSTSTLQIRRSCCRLSPTRILQACLLFAITHLLPVQASLGIPGTTQTENGYDTELGTDAICWKSYGQILSKQEANALGASTSFQASDQSAMSFIELPNPLVDNYFVEGAVKLLRACPTGNSLTTQPPREVLRHERLRTGRTYHYSVEATINLTSFLVAADFEEEQSATHEHELQQSKDPVYELLTKTENYTSSSMSAYVAVQVVICVLGTTGFCSPYIHEESNARLMAENKTTYVPPGDRHGDSHVHSGYQLIELDQSMPIHSIHDYEIPMRINEPGTFLAISCLQLYLRVPMDDHIQTDGSMPHKKSHRIVRYDMANAMSPFEYRLINYQAPAEILQVPFSIRIVSYIAMATAAVTILYLLFHTVKNRNHQVMQLTQGHFLIVFLLSALVATVACVTLDPQLQSCRISHPILLVSLQLMYAITWGRLWRIHSVISPMLLETMRKQQPSCATHFMNGLSTLTNILCGNVSCRHWSTTPGVGKSSGSKRGSVLRRQVTAPQLGAVVALFTLPQLILQVLVVVIQPPQGLIDLNEDESKGREICHRSVSLESSLLVYGYVCFVVLVLLLLFIAQATKSLPSLFNETSVIFESSLSTVILLTIAIGIHIVTDNPETSPGLSYMIWTLLILSTTLNTSLRIMLPKLRMVWNDETVVVSKLVSDNRQANMRSSMNTTATGSFPIYGGFDQSEGTWMGDQQAAGISRTSSHGVPRRRYTANKIANNFMEPVPSSTSDSLGELADYVASQPSELDELHHPTHSSIPPPDIGNDVSMTQFPQNSEDYHNFNASLATTMSDSTAAAHESDSSSNSLRHPPIERIAVAGELTGSRSPPAESASTVPQKPKNLSTSPQRPAIIPVHLDEAPSRRLVLEMVDLQSQLVHVNERICSGLGVSRNEWDRLRQLSTKLGSVFQDQVVFEWEKPSATETLTSKLPSKPPVSVGHSRPEPARDRDDRIQSDNVSGGKMGPSSLASDKRVQAILEEPSDMEEP